MAKTVVDDRARQGPQGRTVLYVLVASMVLCGAALASYMLWSGSQSPTSPSQAASQAQTSGPARSSNSSAVPAANPNYPSPSVNPNAPKP